jgi:hypothetical protein
MKYLGMTLSVLLGSYSFAVAQGNPSGAYPGRPRLQLS